MVLATVFFCDVSTKDLLVAPEAFFGPPSN